MAGDVGAFPSAPGPLPFGAALRSVAPLRSFVVRRSLVGARVACRRDRRGAPPFGRVPFSGVPPPRAVARLPRSLPLSSLLSPTRVLLSPRARRPSSLSPLRALSPAALPRATASHRAPEGSQPPERPRAPLTAEPPERPQPAA